MFAAVRKFASSVFGAKDESESSKRAPRKRPDSQANLPPSNIESRLRRRSSGRKPAEIEAELSRLRHKLELINDQRQREFDFAKRAGARANHRLVEALGKRADSLKHRMKELGAELESFTVTRNVETRRTATPVKSVATNKGRPSAKGTDRSLSQAARIALKKGRFANASERAVFEKILSDLQDGGTDLQLHALERLGELKAGAALPIFSAGARHQDEEVRVAAIRGVLAMRDPSTRSILTTALGDRSHRVRTWAVRGLYGLDDPSLGNVLCDQLHDAHPSVRRTAATYLSWKRFVGAERHLLRVLHDDSLEVRAAVISALGHCGSDRSVFRLIQNLKDDAPQVREATKSALEHLLGAAVEFDANGEEADRAKQIADLKTKWRVDRVKRMTATAEPEDEEAGDDLAGQADVVSDDTSGLGLDENDGVAADDGLVDDGITDEGIGNSSADGLGEDSNETGLEDAGLDVEPDLDGGLDDDVGDFVAAAEVKE